VDSNITHGRLLSQLLQNWVKSVRRYGPLYIAAFPFDVVRVRRSEKAEGFDARFGTDTAEMAYPWNMTSVAHEHTSEIHAYHAAPAWLIREALKSIPLRPYAFVFIDMGSGKGRTLLVASEFPFAKIVGVELSRELATIAEQNLTSYRSKSQRCTTFSLSCTNAAEYTFEAEPLVLFLFNPFGKKTIRRVLANLQASLAASPRKVYLIYINPRFEAIIRTAPLFRKVRTGGAWWQPWSRYVIYESVSNEPPGRHQ
jgi:hypothetical protein